MRENSAPGAPARPGAIPLCVPEIAGNEWAYIKECLDTNWVSSVGPFVDRFEQDVAARVDAGFAVAAVSGTAALHTALLAAGVAPDEEVIVPSLTFIAPVNAIRYVGAEPVFMDSEGSHWQMDMQKLSDFLERQCTWHQGKLRNRNSGRRIAAAIAVHILGHACELDAFWEVVGRYELVTVEDAAEALGVSYRSTHVGSASHVSCFSFNANKIVTAGGGGMLLTGDQRVAARARALINQAKADSPEFVHTDVGYNYRLSNLQAALGCAQLSHLDEHIERKRQLARRYRRALAESDGFTALAEQEHIEATHWMPTVLVDEATFGQDSRQLLNQLQQHGIETRPLWQPAHLSSVYADCETYHCDISERLHQKALSLPCSVGLSDADQNRVIETIRAVR